MTPDDPETTLARSLNVRAIALATVRADKNSIEMQAQIDKVVILASKMDAALQGVIELIRDADDVGATKVLVTDLIASMQPLK